MKRADHSGLLVPDVGSPLRAFREWRRLPRNEQPLWSLWHAVCWEQATLSARCRANPRLADIFGLGHSWPHPAPETPHIDCVCGVYAYWVPHVHVDVFASVVTGVVDVSGVCIVGTKGVRAQTATIRALAPTSDSEGLKRDPVDWATLRPLLAEQYPDVALYSNPLDMWAAWPPQPPVALIEEAQHAAA